LHAIFLGEQDLLPLSPEDARMRSGAPIAFSSFHERDLFASTFPEIDLLGSVPERSFEDASEEDEGENEVPEDISGEEHGAPAKIARVGEITAQLRSLLVGMCGEEHAWLETTLVHGLSVEALASRHLVASASSDLVLVDAEHLATTYALEQGDDPVALAMLTSCVYSAINLFWEEVTDRDEVEAQVWLCGALLDELARPGGR
jgi:hypothetical protein